MIYGQWRRYHIHCSWLDRIDKEEKPDSKFSKKNRFATIESPDSCGTPITHIDFDALLQGLKTIPTGAEDDSADVETPQLPASS
ncbi:hypothetical protein N7467_004991 [Penicillium canescens]|nr:hypothetical protein N7467_004991 [Penicillium canescens]